MSARFGDSFMTLESGETAHFRLTFGALAEICAKLGVNNPKALAKKLLPLNSDDAALIAGAMHFAATAQRRIFTYSDKDYPALSAAIAMQFEAGFSENFL
ncbi:hypothetical protein [Robiginitomaculum antarcticum]|uniref:hypothetical protein n=1 Tax=Robiginitomaculum antarcticum TaxID=437507 RepID=UPI00036762D5|nr:hypothetical protein [Robiginitomaculum antarcticum]